MDILHCLDNSNYGGIQELIFNLHKYDRANRHSFWAADGTMAPEMRRGGMVLWPGGPPAEVDYDIVIGHTVGGWSHDNLSAWARERGAKFIEVLHSNFRSPTKPENVDAFVGVSHTTTALNSQFHRRECIYPIVQPELFQVGPKRGDYIGKLSRLVEEKSPREFIEIARYFPNEFFALAGDGNLREQILPSAPANLEWTGGMVRNFSVFYSQLKLFVFPTKDECCSVAVAMAQAAGVPVICQNIPALRESTGGYARFCSNIQDFTDIIAASLKFPDDFMPTISLAQDWAWRNFRHEVVIPKYNQLFESLI